MLNRLDGFADTAGGNADSGRWDQPAHQRLVRNARLQRLHKPRNVGHLGIKLFKLSLRAQRIAIAGRKRR